MEELVDAEVRAASAAASRRTRSAQARMRGDDASSAAEGRARGSSPRRRRGRVLCARRRSTRERGGAWGGEPRRRPSAIAADATRGEATRRDARHGARRPPSTKLRDALRRRAPPRPAADRRSVSAPVEAVASLEADLHALRRDVAALRPRQQASRPTWLLFAAAGAR